MECFQFFSEQTASHLCHSSSLPLDLSTLTTPTIYWAMAAMASLTLWGILWYDRGKRSVGFLSSQVWVAVFSQLVSLWGSHSWKGQPSITCADGRLRAGMTGQEYELLLYFGYLEIPSKLYPTLFYRILRKRRVHVYDLCETATGQRYQKLGELCVATHDLLPDADSFLLHKWLIEADEQTYLDSTNWVGHSLQTRLCHASGSSAIQQIYRNHPVGTIYLPASG